MKIFAGLICVALAIQPPRVHAGETPNLEYQVKAAFLLNFTRFVEWPPTEPADAPFPVCILGRDPFGNVLDRMLEGESVEGHKLVIRRIKRDQTQSCRIVFIERSERDLARLLQGLGRGVLTVGEGESFLRDGGMISFVIDNRRVRFDINQAAAAAAGLRISSKLLNVARSVEK